MDLDWLEDYLALRELGSFTAAAERQHLSQPAFSRRIQALEAWLGVTLIDRGSRPPRFTQVAIENDARLHRFLSQLYDLRSQLRGEQARASRLRVAISHALSISLFPRLVENLRHNGFQPAYHLTCADRSICIEAMIRGDADMLICYEAAGLPSQIPPAIGRKLLAGADEMIFVGRADMLPAADDTAQPQPQVQRLQVLTYPQSSFFGMLIWDRAMPQLAARFDVETVCVSAFSSAMRAMVLAGLGMAWLPRSLIGPDLTSGQLVAFEPEELRLAMEIAIYARPPHDGGEGGNGERESQLWQHLSGIDIATLMFCGE